MVGIICSAPTCRGSIEFDDPDYTQVFRIILKEYEEIAQNIKEVTTFIKKLAKSSMYKERVQLLKSIPGIGDLSAMTILLEIFNISRFRSGEKIASYPGLVPSEYSSGEKTRRGHLSGMGNKTLRSLFIVPKESLRGNCLDGYQKRSCVIG